MWNDWAVIHLTRSLWHLLQGYCACRRGRGLLTCHEAGTGSKTAVKYKNNKVQHPSDPKDWKNTILFVSRMTFTGQPRHSPYHDPCNQNKHALRAHIRTLRTRGGNLWRPEQTEIIWIFITDFRHDSFYCYNARFFTINEAVTTGYI